MFSNGQYQPEYPRVGDFSFDQDGRSLIYVGYKADGSAELVYLGTVMARGESIAPVRPISSEGLGPLRIGTDAFTGWRKDCPTYLVKRHGWWHLIGPFWEGRPEKAIVQVSTEFPAYIAQRADGKWVMVRDDLPHGPVFDTLIGPLIFSRGGRRAAYAVLIGDMQTVSDRLHMVAGDQLGPPMSMVSTPAFSSDGQHVAYFASTRKQWRAVIDDVDGPRYDEILSRRQPVFQPDRTLQYLAVRDNTLYRVTQRLP